MQDTRDRDSVLTPRTQQGWRWWAILLLVLFLAACASGEGRDRSTASPQPVIVVSTVEPTQGPPTATPTVPPPTATPTPTPPAPLAALVNGRYVFLADYERLVAQYEQSLADFGVDLGSDEGRARLAEVRQEILEGLIDEALVAQAGDELGVAVSDEELSAQLQADIEAGGGQAAFDEWLSSTGQTRQDYRAMLLRSLISQRVWDAVTADVPEAVEQVRARTIVVGSEAEALEILGLLDQGADFVTLVRERSLDQATRDNGGDLGWFPRGVVGLELEQAAFGLQPGEVSAPVAVGERFYIIQVVEREVARPLSSEMLVLLKQSKFEQWLEELRAAAVVERFVGE